MEQSGGRRSLGQVAVGAPVGRREDRFSAVGIADVCEALGHETQRLVP